MACNVHIDQVPRTIAQGVAVELLVSSMRLLPEALLLTETRAGMQTAIFVKEPFLQLSGYSMAEVVDHDPSFLQGPDTDASSFVQFLQPTQTDRIAKHEKVLDRKEGILLGGRVREHA